MTAIGRTPTRPRVEVNVPDEWREITAPYRALLEAAKKRETVPLDQPTRRILDALEDMVRLIDIELVAYVTAQSARISQLEDELTSARHHLAKRPTW